MFQISSATKKRKRLNPLRLANFTAELANQAVHGGFSSGSQRISKDKALPSSIRNSASSVYIDDVLFDFNQEGSLHNSRQEYEEEGSKRLAQFDEYQKPVLDFTENRRVYQKAFSELLPLNLNP